MMRRGVPNVRKYTAGVGHRDTEYTERKDLTCQGMLEKGKIAKGE